MIYKQRLFLTMMILGTALMTLNISVFTLIGTASLVTGSIGFVFSYTKEDKEG